MVAKVADLAQPCPVGDSDRCVNRRHCLLACTGFLASAALAASRPPAHVVFLNPSEPVEGSAGPFWRTVAQFAAVAARSLGMQLEILWAERDDELMLRQCEAVARRPDVPNYVVIVNRRPVVERMLRILEPSPSRTFVIQNGLTPEQRSGIGRERMEIRNWIGTATVDSARGSHLLMEYLHSRLGGAQARVIAMLGDPDAPITQERVRGAEELLAQGNRGRILQVVYGQPSYEDGVQKASLLLSRYPQANVIWAANDSVALGALRAVRDRGTAVLVAGTGGTRNALSSIAQGGLAATVGGHYLVGALALVMLHDHHHGKDFAVDGGPDQRLDCLHVIRQDNAARYDRALFQRGAGLDFSIYSRALHPRTGRYDFRIERLLDTVKPA